MSLITFLRRACALLACLFVLGFTARHVHADNAADPIRPAEQLLFLDDHFAKTKAPATLTYSFEKRGSLTPNSDEKVILKTWIKDGKQVTSLADASGVLPGIAEGELSSNPVITYFLERDINEMQKLTGGQKNYFQRRIRLALAAGPEIVDISVKAGKDTFKAKQVSIQPYLDDPLKSKFQQLVGKRYTFVISSEVPGHLHSIKTEVPADNNNFAAPLEVETLSFDSRH
jgi:hypothetical protein